MGSKPSDVDIFQNSLITVIQWHLRNKNPKYTNNFSKGTLNVNILEVPNVQCLKTMLTEEAEGRVNSL